MTSRSEYRELSDAALVALCIKQERAAWNEFFRRFTKLIKDGIKDTFYTQSNAANAYDPDKIEEVYETIVVKLYRDNILSGKNPLSPLHSWLRKIAENETISWLRASGRDKNLPSKQGEDFSGSLSEDEFARQAVSPDTLTSLIETGDLDDIRRTIDELLTHVTATQTDKVRWVFRLTLIHYLPFSTEEVCQLAKFNGWSAIEIREELERIEKDLSKKEEENIYFKSRAVILWHKLRKLEAQLLEEEKSSIRQSRTLEQMTDEITKIDKRKAEYQRKSETPIRPSNQAVADLVGISADQADQISNIIIRARKALKRLHDAGAPDISVGGSLFHDTKSHAEKDDMSSFYKKDVIKDKV